MRSGFPNVRAPWWCLEYRREPLYTIEDGLSKLLIKLWPCRQRVKEILSQEGISGGLSTTVDIYVDRPVYCLSPLLLARLSYFGVQYCLDIFDYSE